MNMRKFFVIIVLLLLLLSIATRVFHGEKPTPQSVFKEQMDVAPMKYYCSPAYGYNIAYPCFFHEERDSAAATDSDNHARFIFTTNTTIIIETYVIPAPRKSARACALALAGSRSKETQAAKNSFILTGRVYENGQPTDGYSHYTKYIKSGRILFVYSLIYPEDYKPVLGRMFRTIDNWTMPGAY